MTMGFKDAVEIVRPALDPREPDHSRQGIFVHHNCHRCRNGTRLDRCPTPKTPGNCGEPMARND